MKVAFEVIKRGKRSYNFITISSSVGIKSTELLSFEHRLTLWFLSTGFTVYRLKQVCRVRLGSEKSPRIPAPQKGLGREAKNRNQD